MIPYERVRFNDLAVKAFLTVIVVEDIDSHTCALLCPWYHDSILYIVRSGVVGRRPSQPELLGIHSGNHKSSQITRKCMRNIVQRSAAAFCRCLLGKRVLYHISKSPSYL